MEMILKKLIELLMRYTIEQEKNIDFNLDVRKMIVDSIAYIQFLADVEEEFNIDIDFDVINNLQIVSINALSNVVSEYCKGSKQ